MQEAPLFQNHRCSWGKAPRLVLQSLLWAPGSQGRKLHGNFMTKNVFYISAESLSLLHLLAEEEWEQQRTGAGSRA